MNSLKRILITGASGGLGEALARHYAGPGVELILWARDADRLQAVADACRQQGAEAAWHSIDLLDVSGAVAALEEDDAQGAITLMLLAAGLGDIQAPDAAAEIPAQVERLGIVNFVAPTAMAAALGARMAARGDGRIVFVGSAAAFHALPFAASYAGSKAGLARYAQALRIGLAPRGVGVTLVSPGFIDTAAGRTASGPRPFLMTPAHVAARIAKAAARKQAHLILPWPFAWLRVLDRLLPGAVRDRVLRSLAP
ncbi:oxidoreductase [Nostoc sp. 3335mG]|nr:oxidoreductase [Nostoc sp. 3335mG]